MMNEPQTYIVPAAAHAETAKVLKRLATMAERRGLPLVYTWSEEARVQQATTLRPSPPTRSFRSQRTWVLVEQEGNRYTWRRMVYDLTVESWPDMDTPWDLMATITPADPNGTGTRPGVLNRFPTDRDEEGKPVYADEDTLPAWLPADMVDAEGDVVFHDRCDHCDSGRRGRNKGVLVRHREEGTVAYVGSSCLLDYMGIPDNMAENMVKVKTLMLDGYGGGPRWERPVVEVYDAARMALLMQPPQFRSRLGQWCLFGSQDLLVDADGHVWDEPDRSNGHRWTRGKPVGSLPWATLNPDAPHHRRTPCGTPLYLPEDFDLTPQLGDVEGLLASAREATGGFGANLRAVLKAGVVSRKTANLFVGAVAGYRRGMSRAAAQAKREAEQAALPESVHMGSVGERLTVTGEVVSVRAFDGMYGPSNAVTFRTDDGNDVSWFTSSPPAYGRATVTGKVKRHSEFKGRAQTTLGGRVRVEVA